MLQWGRLRLNLAEVPWRDRREGPSSFWDWDRLSRSPSWTSRPYSAKLPKQHDGWSSDSMAPISITRAYEAKLKSRKQKINCNRQFSTPLSFLSTVDSFLRATTYNQGRVSVIYPCGAVFLEPETEIKRITSEIITQFRRANSVST